MRLLLAALLLAGCSSFGPSDEAASRRRVSISSSRDSYTPLMSSIVGIGLKPVYAEGKHSRLVTFHWTTNYGYFLKWGPPDFKVRPLGPSTSTDGGEVYWSYDPIDIDEEKPPVIIVLTVRDRRNDHPLARSELRLEWENVDTVRLVERGDQ